MSPAELEVLRQGSRREAQEIVRTGRGWRDPDNPRELGRALHAWAQTEVRSRPAHARQRAGRAPRRAVRVVRAGMANGADPPPEPPPVADGAAWIGGAP
jgi:hypothetical protein